MTSATASRLIKFVIRQRIFSLNCQFGLTGYCGQIERWPTRHNKPPSLHLSVCCWICPLSWQGKHLRNIQWRIGGDLLVLGAATSGAVFSSHEYKGAPYLLLVELQQLEEKVAETYYDEEKAALWWSRERKFRILLKCRGAKHFRWGLLF